MADVRRAVREHLDGLAPDSLVLVALSGGPDSLALAAALAFEAPRAGLKAGAVIVDHGLQDGSDAVAQSVRDTAVKLGLDPVDIRRVEVKAANGPEADARLARYAGIEEVARERVATAVMLGHTLDDQAETVLLGLSRGAGPTSLSGMSGVSGLYRRPLLGIRRAQTVAACADQGLEVWNDPHNEDPRYTRVRLRRQVMPALEENLGPGVAEALARTADQLREDTAVVDSLAAEIMPRVFISMPSEKNTQRIAELDISELEKQPAAIYTRVIRKVALDVFAVSLSRTHTLAITQLFTAWHGQQEVNVPGIRVERTGSRLIFTSTKTSNDKHQEKN